MFPQVFFCAEKKSTKVFGFLIGSFVDVVVPGLFSPIEPTVASLAWEPKEEEEEAAVEEEAEVVEEEGEAEEVEKEAEVVEGEAEEVEGEADEVKREEEGIEEEEEIKEEVEGVGEEACLDFPKRKLLISTAAPAFSFQGTTRSLPNLLARDLAFTIG